MPIIQTRPLQVGIIPAWMAEKLSQFGKPDYMRCLSFADLAKDLDTDNAILTSDELNYYIAVQLMKDKVTGELFDDIPSIVWTDANLKYVTGEVTVQQDNAGRPLRLDHDMLLNAVCPELRKYMESSKERARLAKAVGDECPDGEWESPEHYIPLYMDGGVLLLVGSPDPVYADKRSFCDAVLTALGNHYDFTQLKALRLMRGFLRDHV